MSSAKIAIVLGVLVLTGCAAPVHHNTVAGATIGGIAGAVLGHQVDGEHGRFAGAAAGALIGAAIGNNADAIADRRGSADYESGYPNYVREPQTVYRDHGHANHDSRHWRYRDERRREYRYSEK